MIILCHKVEVSILSLPLAPKCSYQIKFTLNLIMRTPPLYNQTQAINCSSSSSFTYDFREVLSGMDSPVKEQWHHSFTLLYIIKITFICIDSEWSHDGIYLCNSLKLCIWYTDCYMGASIATITFLRTNIHTIHYCLRKKLLRYLVPIQVQQAYRAHIIPTVTL